MEPKVNIIVAARFRVFLFLLESMLYAYNFHIIKLPLLVSALKLDDKIGNFAVGKDFDALVIDVFVMLGPLDDSESPLDDDKSEKELIEEMVQRFVFSGDDRNVVQVYIKGHLAKNMIVL